MFRKGLYAIILTVISSSLWAETTIIGVEIPGLHQKDGGGVYDVIINGALVSTGMAKLKVLPPARADADFEACQNCCYSPANKNPEFYSFGSDIVESEPMDVAKVYIFSPPGKGVYSSLQELKGKKVATRHGMNYGKSFNNANLKVSAANSLEQNIKKLEGGRTDAMVAFIPDAYLTFKSMGKSEFPHAKDKPVAVHKDALVCRGVSANFVEEFNKKLKSLSASGELDKILNGS